MAAKRNARDVTPSPPVNKSGSSTPTTTVPAVKTAVSKSKDASLSAQEVAVAMWDNYVKATPQRTKLIDVFMAFLVVVGVLQFVYCVIVGNYVSAVQSAGIKGILLMFL
jgi:oligosaccharyltransferase complex subunit epsilon